MEDKIKIIAISLGAVLLVSLFMNFQIYSAKKSLERERDDLRHENATLNKQVEEGRKEKQRLDEKINALNGEMEKLNQQGAELKKDKDELEKRFDALAKEKKDLEDKIKALEAKEKESSAAKTNLPNPAEEAYWAKILKAKTDLEVQVESLKGKLKATQTDNNQLKREKSILEMDYSSISREKQELDQQLNSIDSMSLELVKEKTAKLKTQDTLRFLKAENAVLRRQLKALSVYRSSLEKKLQKVQGDKSDLEKKFNEMEVLLENRLAQVGELRQRMDAIRGGDQAEAAQEKRESVELPPIVVYPKAGSAIEPQQEGGVPGVLHFGKVLSVNRENNFIVVDLGEAAGAKVGDTLQVYRNGQPVASVEVIQTRKGVSACDIKQEVSSIKADDLVR